MKPSSIRRTGTLRLLTRLTALAVVAGLATPFSADAQDASTPREVPVATPTATPTPAVVAEGALARGVKSLTSDDDDSSDGRGFHVGPLVPRADITSSGGGVAPVLHFWTPNIGGSSFDLHASASYSIYEYQYYDAQFGLLPHRGGRLPRVETSTNALFPLADLEKTSDVQGFNIYASARYRDYPREDYYGIGSDTVRESHADYRLQDGLYEGVIRYGFSKISIMGRAGLLRTDIREGKDADLPNVEAAFAESAAPGRLIAPDFIHYSAGIWFEFRDEPRNPHRGVSLGIAASRFDDRNGAAFEFSRFSVDAREYLPLGSNRHVLALRQVVSADRADDGSSIPFYMLSTLGGGSLLRAFPSFRFRDDRLMLLASEYRFEATPRIELALIYEAGKVLSEDEDFDFRDLRSNYGAGVRFKSRRKVHFRVDAVRGSEGMRWHVKVGRSF